MPQTQINEKSYKTPDIFARVPKQLSDDFIKVKNASGDMRDSHTVAKLITAGIRVFKERGIDGFNKFINTANQNIQ